MSTVRRLALVAAVLLAIAARPGLSTARAGNDGPISRRGTYEGGRYLIEVPANWNGGLVLYAMVSVARSTRPWSRISPIGGMPSPPRATKPRATASTGS